MAITGDRTSLQQGMADVASGPVLAIVVSGVVFGLTHGINVVLPAAMLLGVLNAVLYLRSRSIWPAVTAHAVNDGIVFVTIAELL